MVTSMTGEEEPSRLASIVSSLDVFPSSQLTLSYQHQVFVDSGAQSTSCCQGGKRNVTQGLIEDLELEVGRGM
ncbi:uncharacterized protein A4U43_C09F11320 [Asparagus officinalis]|uniref:Uncharacterized protein n=1 Tax=Asparagus officinalis TaxID=4686 RepID=A0A5P1E6T0_ASPOF|nr:uncharacterized protein A4U43_C09F11320 [Asparagus officinalis]